MKKVLLLVVLISLTITNAYSWFEPYHTLPFVVNGTIYPFPMNISVSDLQIKGDITDVTTISHRASIRFGEETKIEEISSSIYKFENGRLAYLCIDAELCHHKLYFNYDSQGRLVKVKDDDYDIIYCYDENDRLNKVDYLYGERLMCRWVIEYNTEKNFKISAYHISLNGKLEYEWYYDNGLLTKDIFYDYFAKKREIERIYSYDSHRRVINIFHSKFGQQLYTSYNEKGWDARYDYVSDSKGNWTLKREKSNTGERYELTERMITYK